MEFENRYDRPGFQFYLTMDCEGTNFDKNLRNNVMKLEKLLKITSAHNVYVILFITPYFADTLKELDLIEKLNSEYKVVYGLHIHPDNLPEEIKSKCQFLNNKFVHMTDYDFSEQKKIIIESLNYFEGRGIKLIQGFRGGYFSIDDETAKILRAFTDIKWESHNIYRKEYKITQKEIRSFPVSALDDKNELRLENYNEVVFDSLIMNAKRNGQKLVGITHSYLLDEKDHHYVRDRIPFSIYEVLEKVLEKIEA